jgi:hypothetical protein
MGDTPSNPIRRALKWAWFLLGLPMVFLTLGAVIGGVVMLRTEMTPWLYQATVDEARQNLTGKDGRNAALGYWRIWHWYADELDGTFERAGWYIAEVPEDPEERAEWQKDFEERWNPAWGDRNDPSFLEDEDLQWAIDRLILAASYERCDFDPALEEGIPALFPHLGELRTSVRLLCADARRVAREGDSDAAIERLEAALTTARRAENDRMIISSLVSMAGVGLVYGEASYLRGEGFISAEQVGPLAQRLASLATHDFALRDALDTERRWHLIGITMVSQMPYQQPLVEVSMRAFGSGEDRAEEINAYHDRLVAAWSSDEPTSELLILGTEADRGDFGPMMQSQTDSYIGAWSSLDRMHSKLRIAEDELTQ